MAKTVTIMQPGTSAGVVYTSPNAQEIVGASVCGAGGASTITVHLVKSGDSLAADTMVYNALSVAASGAAATVFLNALFNVGLKDGDAIHALAADAATLTLMLTTRDAA